MIRSKNLVFDDHTIELKQNTSLSSRQYLLQLTGWNNYYDFRANKDDLQRLAKFILEFIESEASDNESKI